MKSIRLKIGFITLLIMVIAFTSIGLISIITAKKSLETELIKALEESVSATADSIKASNDREFKMLETLAALPEIRDPNVSLLDKTHTIYGAMSLDKDYIDVCILDTAGFAWINNGVRMIPFKERQYFQQPFKTGKRFVTDPFINKVTSAPAVFYSVPVFDDKNNVINVLFCVIEGLKPSYLATNHRAGDNRPAFLITLNEGPGGEGEAFAELHSPGIIIASEDLLAEDLPMEEFTTESIFAKAEKTSDQELIEQINRIKTEQNGIIKYKLEGEQYVLAFEKVPETNWVAINKIPYSDFQADINKMRNAVIVYIAFITILAVIIVSIAISRSIKPLKDVKDAISEIATGNADLTRRISLHSNDEIGSVVKGFNQFEEKLQNIIADIKESKEKLASVGNNMKENASSTTESIASLFSNIEDMQVQIVTQGDSVNLTASSVTEISANIQSLERMIETQATGVTQASAAVEQMMGNISSVNKSIDIMADSFEQLLDNTDTGVEKQEIVSQKIKDIESQSEALQGANTVIATIASQTNLLAMNAAIEAAHAGDAGRGFSVVADEIKKLSESSSQESNKINEQLNEIMNSITEVVQASVESMDAFKKVSELINSTNEMVLQIKNAMDEQNSGSKQIFDALYTMNNNTSEVRSASREMSIGNQSVLDEIKNLQEATNSMKNSMSLITEGADRINRTGNELDEITPKLMNTIDHISAQIDQFKV